MATTSSFYDTDKNEITVEVYDADSHAYFINFGNPNAIIQRCHENDYVEAPWSLAKG